VFAVVSLALGIAVTTAVYSVLYSILWQPLEVKDPQRVMFVTAPVPGSGRLNWRAVMSRADFRDLSEGQGSFSDLAASTSFSQSLASDRVSEIVDGEAVTGNYFQTLGITAALGRPLQPADDTVSASVVVISHRLWRSRFGADPHIVGRGVRVGAHQFEIVGVAPESFIGLERSRGLYAAVWIPAGGARYFSNSARTDPEDRDRRQWTVVGRLSPGRTAQTAAAEVAAIGGRLDAAFPIHNVLQDGRRPVVPRRWSGALVADPNLDALPVRLDLLILGLVVLVLVVACTNLANLMLARGTMRQHEIAVRRALGASRWRLIRELSIEGVMIALLGGFAALLVTRVLLILMAVDLPIPRGTFSLEPRLNVPAVVVASSALLLSLLVFGIEPAVQLTKKTVAADLAGAPGTVGVPRSRRQRMLIRWQVAISTCFFLIAAVLARIILVEVRSDPGIALNRLALATVHFKFQGWDERRARQALDVALDAARREPGIESVSASSGMPFGLSMTPFADLSTPDKPIVRGRLYKGGHVLASTPEIFRTLGVEIVRGRAFDLRDDSGTRPVAVISEHGARLLFGSTDVIGRETLVQVWGQPPAKTFTIVGIARDTDTDRRLSRSDATLYVPLAQHYEPNLAIVARTNGDPAATARTLQIAVRKADPDLSTGSAGPATMLLAGQFVAARVGGLLAAALGLLTLTLSMVGLYGVQSHIVARRTREVGVRMALGASDRQIERLVLREGFTPVVQGLVLGLLFGVLARLGLRALLTAAIAIFDPIAFSVIPVVLFAAAFFACYMPARRAAHVDPNVALRQL
jgi:putative ABC transport system permease protein